MMVTIWLPPRISLGEVENRPIDVENIFRLRHITPLWTRVIEKRRHLGHVVSRWTLG